MANAPPWTPDQPLRADATNEQIIARGHALSDIRFDGVVKDHLAKLANVDALVAREFAAACVEAKCAAMATAEKYADLLAQPPVRSEAPTQCARCRQWFVPNPTMANASCTVHHSAGSCCHFTETEVAAPVPSEETPVAWALVAVNDEQNVAAMSQRPAALEIDYEADIRNKRLILRPLYLHPSPLPQEEPTREQVEALRRTSFPSAHQVVSIRTTAWNEAVAAVLALFPKATKE